MGTILLTGATGFLGSHLTRRLLKDGAKLVLLKRSFSNCRRIEQELSGCRFYDLDKATLSEIFKENDIETIFHCATDYGTSSDINEVVAANLLLPLSLCQMGLQYKVKYFVNTDTVLGKRINTYALSKKQFSEWMPYFAQNRLVCVNMALEHFYGPLDNKTKFVSRMISDILENKERIPLTAGEQKRDFIYIDDVISAFMAVYRNLGNMKPGVYNYEVGTNNNTTIKDLVLKIKSLAGNTNTILDFGAIPYRDHEIMESRVDTTSLRALGWEPGISLEEGLKMTIKDEMIEKRSRQ